MDREFEATFDAEGHFDIPIEVRQKHGIRNGSKATIEDRDKEFVIKPVEQTGNPTRERMKQAIESAVGMLGNDRAMFDAFLEERKAERENEDRDLHTR